MSYSNAFCKLFYIFDYVNPVNVHFSDKVAINYLNSLSPEERKNIDLSLAMRHLREFPSEKRFNIFMKYINKQNIKLDQKERLIHLAFMSGNVKFFKRAYTLFAVEAFEGFIQKIRSEYSTTIYNNVDLSKNCEFLKKTLPAEEYIQIKPILAAVLFYRKNINSFLYWATNMQEYHNAPYTEKRSVIFHFKQDYLDKRKVNNFRDKLFEDFYETYKESIYINIDDIIEMALFAKKNSKAVFNFFDQKDNLSNIFNPPQDAIIKSAFLKINYYSTQKREQCMIKNIDVFFDFINFCPVNHTSELFTLLELDFVKLSQDLFNKRKVVQHLKEKIIDHFNNKFNNFGYLIHDQNVSIEEIILKIKTLSEQQILGNLIRTNSSVMNTNRI